MDVMLLTPTLSTVTVEAAFNGGPPVPIAFVPPLPAVIIPPPGTTDMRVWVRTLAPATRWSTVGDFTVSGGTITAAGNDPEWSPLARTTFGLADAVALTVTLSMVRDVTVMLSGTLRLIDPTNPTQSLNMKRGSSIPADWRSDGPPDVWERKQLSGCFFVADPPVDGNGKVHVESHSPLTPASEALVLEVEGVACPQTVAVVWPAAVSRAANAAPTPLLVYFHHSIGQELGAGFYPPSDPELGEYPFGFDYAYFGLWRYVNYAANPITGDEHLSTLKGLAYQMAVAGRPVVLVVPCSKMQHVPEIGDAADPSWLMSLLTAIQSHMFRRAGTLSAPPALGRVGVASFSGGCSFVADMLRKMTPPAGTSPDFVSEAYLFDPGLDINVACVDAVANWAGGGNAASKRARLYTQWQPANANRLNSPNGSIAKASAIRGPRTAAILPPASWNNAVASAGGTAISADWTPTHALISASMLTDALRASGF